MTKEKRITIRLEAATLQRVRQVAKRAGRTTADWTRRAIKTAVEKNFPSRQLGGMTGDASAAPDNRDNNRH